MKIFLTGLVSIAVSMILEAVENEKFRYYDEYKAFVNAFFLGGLLMGFIGLLMWIWQ